MASNVPNIFLEAAHQASIVPLASEATIYAMKSFGEFAMELPVTVAIAGGLAGHLFNWWLGKILMKLPSSPKNHRVFATLETHACRYGFLALFFAFVPLGNVLVVASGMLGVPIKKALPMITAGLFYHYGSLLG